MEIENIAKLDVNYLLVGCESVKERDGMSELWHVLVKYCQIIPIEVFELPIKGLFLMVIPNNPLPILEKIGKVINERKFEFRICKKFTPIEKIIKSDLDEMMKNLPCYLEKIPRDAKWRIVIHRRHTKIDRQEIIKKIVEHSAVPKGKVDLENAEWDILIEIFGEWLGFGVYPSISVVSVKNKKCLLFD